MALKAKLTKDEFGKLAEPLKEHYKASGDDYLLDAEGVEDVSGLKSALAKEKEERRQLKTKLEAEVEKWKDLDPERAREAIKAIADLDDKKLVDKGEYDRLLDKKQKEFDAREVDYKKQLADRDSRLNHYELVTPVQEALLKAGVMPDRIEDAVMASARFVKLDEKRKVVVLDKDGDPTTKTLEEFASSQFKEAKPWLYAASGAGGSGAPPNPNGGKATGRVVTLAEQQAMTAQESTQFFKDGGKVAA